MKREKGRKEGQGKNNRGKERITPRPLSPDLRPIWGKGGSGYSIES